MPLRHNLFVLALSAWACAVTPAAALGSVQTTVVALSGHPSPDGNGMIVSFERTPVLNDNGVAIVANLSQAGTVDTQRGLLLGSNGQLDLIARNQQAAGDGTVFSDLRFPAINTQNRVSFLANLESAADNADAGEGVFLGNASTLNTIARTGDPAPGGLGTLTSFVWPALNNQNQIAFLARATQGNAVVRGDVNGLDLINASPRFISETEGPAINESGQVAYLTGNNVKIGSQEVPLPDGVGGSLPPALNDLGVVAFRGRGIDRGTGASFTTLVEGSDLTPEGDVFGTLRDPAINNAGVVSFRAANDRGLFSITDGIVETVARGGDATPDASSTFEDLSSPALNEHGQIAFFARLSDGAGVYHYDPAHGITEMVRTGDILEGSPITSVRFATGVGEIGTERSGFNDHGDVAYRFSLQDGRTGIAIARLNGTLELLGDYDASGQVEQGDLNLVLSNWGSPRGPWPNADGFTTNIVDQEELNDILSNWGSAMPPTFEGAAVPEPAALLGVMGGLAWMRRRR